MVRSKQREGFTRPMCGGSGCGKGDSFGSVQYRIFYRWYGQLFTMVHRLNWVVLVYSYFSLFSELLSSINGCCTIKLHKGSSIRSDRRITLETFEPLYGGQMTLPTLLKESNIHFTPRNRLTTLFICSSGETVSHIFYRYPWHSL